MVQWCALGVMKRPEYREAGKVGSCENCSAWQDARHAPGGLGGACVQKPACAWVPPICVWENARWHGWLVVPMGGTRSQTTSLTHAPPQTPRRVANVAPIATILHTATSRFSSPHAKPPGPNASTFNGRRVRVMLHFTRNSLYPHFPSAPYAAGADGISQTSHRDAE